MTRYRPVVGPAPRRVIDVVPESVLEAMVLDSGAYELVDDELEEAGQEGTGDETGGQEPAGETPASDPATVPAASLPPVPPAAPAPVEAAPVLSELEAAVLAAAFETNTAEGVNGYLDQHPAAAELVIAHEKATRGDNARKGIVHGRHGTPADAPAAE